MTAVIKNQNIFLPIVITNNCRKKQHQTTVSLTKKLHYTIIYFIHLYSIYHLLVKVNNILTHTKQFAFHAHMACAVYSVGFDVFTFARPRRQPVFWQDEPFTPAPVSEQLSKNEIQDWWSFYKLIF